MERQLPPRGQDWSRRRRLAAVVVGLAVAGGTFATLDEPTDAMSSPVIAIALSGVATALTLHRQDL
jgi:hypothetical protein